MGRVRLSGIGGSASITTKQGQRGGYKALTSRHKRPSLPHPLHRNRDLLPITTTHPIGKDIHPMPLFQEIQRGLQDTHMGLDADDGDGRGHRDRGGDVAETH